MEKYFELTTRLINALENSNLNHLDLSFEDFSISLDKNTSTQIRTSTNEEKKNSIEIENAEINENVEVFKAPVLGIFYKARDPESKPFAEVGDTLKKGDTLCIIEAMKMMNEVKAPYDCKVIECLVMNEEFVEYDKAIFKLEKLC